MDLRVLLVLVAVFAGIFAKDAKDASNTSRIDLRLRNDFVLQNSGPSIVIGKTSLRGGTWVNKDRKCDEKYKPDGERFVKTLYIMTCAAGTVPVEGYFEIKKSETAPVSYNVTFSKGATLENPKYKLNAVKSEVTCKIREGGVPPVHILCQQP